MRSQNIVSSQRYLLSSSLRLSSPVRWDATRSIDDVTFYQSALLHCSYNYVQIVVHRPYITPRHPYKGSTDSHDLAFPSLAICTNAARSCSHILEVCLRRGTMLAPQLNNCAFTAAIVLLFNIWGMNKPGMVVRVDWKKQMQDVHICMRFIKRTVARYVGYICPSGNNLMNHLRLPVCMQMEAC